MWLSLLKYNYKDYFLDDDHTSTLNKQREQFKLSQNQISRLN